MTQLYIYDDLMFQDLDESTGRSNNLTKCHTNDNHLTAAPLEMKRMIHQQRRADESRNQTQEHCTMI